MTASFHLNRAAVKRVVDAAKRGLPDAAENLIEHANRTAPIEEGTLIRSAVVVVSADGTQAAAGYDTPYAARQHEDTRLRHDDGRRAKWLQRTLDERRTTLVEFIGKKMRGAL